MPLSVCVEFRLFLPEFVFFSLKIDDFDSVNGGGCDGEFVESETICCCCCVVAVNCVLTFHGHANGGALHIISCKKITGKKNIK